MFDLVLQYSFLFFSNSCFSLGSYSSCSSASPSFTFLMSERVGPLSSAPHKGLGGSGSAGPKLPPQTLLASLLFLLLLHPAHRPLHYALYSCLLLFSVLSLPLLLLRWSLVSHFAAFKESNWSFFLLFSPSIHFFAALQWWLLQYLAFTSVAWGYVISK